MSPNCYRKPPLRRFPPAGDAARGPSDGLMTVEAPSLPLFLAIHAVAAAGRRRYCWWRERVLQVGRTERLSSATSRRSSRREAAAALPSMASAAAVLRQERREDIA